MVEEILSTQMKDKQYRQRTRFLNNSKIYKLEIDMKNHKPRKKLWNLASLVE